MKHDKDSDPFHSLLVPGHHDTDTAAGNIFEADMESTEFVSNDEEHAKWLLRVFYLWQEIWCKTERKSDFGWLIKVS